MDYNPIPSDYNIAVDCVDKHQVASTTRDKTAMIYVRELPQGELVHQALPFDYFFHKTNAFAYEMRSRGLKPGDRIVLRFGNGPDFAVAFLGAIKAGVIPIPTSPLLKEKELIFIAEDSGARFVLAERDLLGSFSEEGLKKCIQMDWLTLDNFTLFPIAPTNKDDPAYWLYTSGTEGFPKGVIHAHRSIPAHDGRVMLWQNAGDGDVVFNTSSLNWSYALTAGFLDLWRHGIASVVYRGALKPEQIVDIVEELDVSVFMSVPGLYRRLTDFMEKENCGFEPARVCLSAGEKLPGELRERFIGATGLDIYEGLGMTEHSVYLVQPFAHHVVDDSCGTPLLEAKVAILDEQGAAVAAGEPGILASHRTCPGLMLGYHNRPQDEKKMFQGEWFLSGDVARVDAEGNFFYLGRSDDMITAGGYRISPLEVEMALNACPGVQESAVVGVELEKGKTIVTAYVVYKGEGAVPKGSPGDMLAPTEETKRDLLEYIQKNLAPFKVPREIVWMESLPKTSNGKLMRKNLAIGKKNEIERPA